MTDWLGNKASAFSMTGVNYQTKKESEDREHRDYYATEPRAVRLLMEKWNLQKDTLIWECACGEGHLAKELENMGYPVFCSDIIDRGYQYQLAEIDFLNFQICLAPCILTNPPYRYVTEFILHSLELLPEHGYCAMLLNICQLSGKARFRQIYKNNPPKMVYVFTGRIQCAKNGDFGNKENGAINYAWFIWQKGYKGNTIIDWIES